MKLSFECNLDPRLLPTKNGKKYCDNCQHHVVDLRRKSDEKIALFFEENKNPCVIIHEEQLARLPKKKRNISSSGIHYFPYAAGIITAAFLPALTIAQTETAPTVQIIGHTPVPFLVPQSIKDTPKPETKKTVEQKYVLNGRVNVRDKNFKIKNGKGVVIFRKAYDSTGNYLGHDTLVMTKLGAGGKFKLKLTKEQFDQIQNSKEELYINVDVFRRERIDEITISQNGVNILLSVSAKRGRAFMGKF